METMRLYDEKSWGERTAVPIVAHNIFSRRVEPSFIVDISDFLEEKMAAIRAHKSQFYDPASSEPETRIASKHYLDELEGRSRYFGSLISVAAGEPFYVHQPLNVPAPLPLPTTPTHLSSSPPPNKN